MTTQAIVEQMVPPRTVAEKTADRGNDIVVPQAQKAEEARDRALDHSREQDLAPHHHSHGVWNRSPKH